MTGPLLSILTVGNRSEVGLLASPGEDVRSMFAEGLKGQDARLPALAEDLLSETGLRFDDLGRITVCIGPGSFTGVRVGVAYARGLALALDVPCIGVTSLMACVEPTKTTERVRVALVAKKRPPDQTAWTQVIDTGGPLGPAEEWRFDAFEAGAMNLVGDVPFAMASVRPNAENIANWGARLSPQQHPPKPAYVRVPDAKLPGGKAP
ncbi:MAG: tRNA (adenosine(37)-N6)-threonylcarbamoyltransferase complex dimerization subunit type 1 TsaB [Pseudomonadota bacterium]